MKIIKKNDELSSNNYSKAMHLAIIVANISLFLWVIWYCQYGLDVTDEGFYFNWIKNPYNFKASISLFGFFYHFFYNLFDWNIIFLRQFNVLLTFSLSWLLGFLFLRRYLSQIISFKITILYSASLAISSLVFYNIWIPTPSYNLMNFHSLMIVSIGILIISNQDNIFRIFFGWILISLGGVICFIAKPSSAMMLSLLTVIYLSFCYKKLKHIAWGALLALVFLIIFMFVIHESPQGLYLRLSEGLRLAQLLGSGYEFKDLFRVDKFQLDYINYIILTLLAALALFTTKFANSKNPIKVRIAFLTNISLLIFVIILMSGKFNFKEQVSILDPKIIICICFAFFGQALFIEKVKISTLSFQSRGGIILFLLFLPFVYTFGTNNNYWQAANNVSFFWILSSIAIIVPVINEQNVKALFISHSVLIIFTTGTLLYQGISFPYRQPEPLYDYTYKVELEKNSNFLMNKEMAEYFTSLKNFSSTEGLNADTPMIDLTGHSPGVLSVLGVSVIGQPWLLGGYPGSEAFVKDLLSNLPCELTLQSWVVTEEGGTQAISSSVLRSIGLHLEKNYKLIYSIKAPMGLTGHKRGVRTQFFYKPSLEKPNSLSACLKAKQLTEFHHKKL